MPAVKTQLTEMGANIVGNSPQDFAAFVQSEIVKWQKVAKEAGIEKQQAGRPRSGGGAVTRHTLYGGAILALCLSAPIAALQSSIGGAGQCSSDASEVRSPVAAELQSVAGGALDLQSRLVIGTTDLVQVCALLCLLKLSQDTKESVRSN